MDITETTRKLQQAGIAFSGCNTAGIIWGADGTTEIQTRKDVQDALKLGLIDEAHKTTDQKLSDLIATLEAKGVITSADLTAKEK